MFTGLMAIIWASEQGNPTWGAGENILFGVFGSLVVLGIIFIEFPTYPDEKHPD